MSKKYKIAFALTGSFCTFSRIMEEIKKLVSDGHEIQPILSYHAANTDTRFMTAQTVKQRLFEITGKMPWETLAAVEPIGPKKLADVLVIAPCTGNTLAKLAAGINDTPVLLAAKSHMRNGGSVLLAISTNDGLSASAQNIGKLMNTKNIFFVPFAQDNFIQKPNSLQADFSFLLTAIEAAYNKTQLQPIILQKPLKG